MHWFETADLKFMPFAVEAVQWVVDKGLKIALCSGGPRDEIKLKLKRKGLDKYFETIKDGEYFL